MSAYVCIQEGLPNGTGDGFRDFNMFRHQMINIRRIEYHVFQQRQ